MIEIGKDDAVQNEGLSDEIKSKITSSFDQIIKNEKIDSTNFTDFVDFILDKNIKNKVYSEIVDLLGKKENEIMSEEVNSSESKFDWESFQIKEKHDLKNFLNEVSNSKVEFNDELKEKISKSVKEFYLKQPNENQTGKDFFSQIFDKNNEDKAVGKFVLDLISSFDDEKENIEEDKKEEDSVNSNQKEEGEKSNSEENDGNSGDDKKEEDDKNSNHEFLNSENFKIFQNFFESKIKEKEDFNKIMAVMFINLTKKMESFYEFSQDSMFEQSKDKISAWGEQLDHSLDQKEVDGLENFVNNLEKSQIQPMLDFLIGQIQKKKEDKSIEDERGSYDAMILIFKNFIEKQKNNYE